MICATKQIPNTDPKFHQTLIVDDVGKSTRALSVIFDKGYLFRVCLFIILCVVVVCSLSCMSQWFVHYLVCRSGLFIILYVAVVCSLS